MTAPHSRTAPTARPPARPPGAWGERCGVRSSSCPGDHRRLADSRGAGGGGRGMILMMRVLMMEVVMMMLGPL
jgi:hypothetical protein